MNRKVTSLIGPWPGVVAIAAGVLGLGCATAKRATKAPAPNVETTADTKPLEDFRERVNAYAKLVKREDDKAPDLRKKSRAGEIESYELTLAKAIRAARPNAKQGDIFSPDVKPVFARILASELKGSWNAGARKTAAEGNPDADGTALPVVAVNATYRDAPMGTFPTTLLQKLPELPKQLEYRFVGRDLVLRDRGAGLIVDFIQDAAPPLPKEKH